MKCTFIADLHLDPSLPERTDAFRRFLALESPRCDELYVLGDLTEVWVGDDDDSEFALALGHDLAAASARCRVHLMHGNRDFLIGNGFANTCGVTLIDDPCLIERNGLRILLCHGDQLCTADTAYQRARSMLRSPGWQRDVLTRSLADRRTLAAHMRHQSRVAKANKPANIMDADPDAIDRIVREYAADSIVHGHTHRPSIDRAGDARRYVLGDWDRCGWVLRFDGSFTLQRFALERRYGT